MNRRLLPLFLLVVCLVLLTGFTPESALLRSAEVGHLSLPVARSVHAIDAMEGGTSVANQNVDFISHLQTLSSSATIQGQYAYVGEGYHLSIYDVSDPAAPTRVSTTALLPDVVREIVVVGNYAYVAESMSGLRVFNVANPDAPIEVGSYVTPNHVWGVAVAGNYAYVADAEGGLRVINVANPAAPVSVGSVDTPGYAFKVSIAGNYAYVADDNAGLQVIDVTNPAAPVAVGSVDTPGNAYDVTVTGNLAYVADYGAGLQIINVTDVAHPSIAKTVGMPGPAWDVVTSGNYAYVVADEGGLRIIDISLPTSAYEVGSSSVDSDTYSEGVAIAGNFAYVTDVGRYGGLRVINVANPVAPVVTGFWMLPGEIKELAVVGDYVYTANGQQGGLQVINVADPAGPVVTGFVESSGSGRDVAVAGSYAYLVDGDGLWVMEISDPAAPVAKGFIETLDYAYGVAVAGSYTYVADWGSGLRIIDVSNPEAPQAVAIVDTGGRAFGVTVVGNYAYVADCETGLRVINVTVPTAPVEVGSLAMPDCAYEVEVSGNYAYVADAGSGLRVVNVTNPAAPVEVGSFTTANIYAMDVVLLGGRAYIADAGGTNGGLRVINVANPAAPVLAGSYNTNGWTSGVAVAGDYTFLANRGFGLYIFKYVSSSPAPTVTSFSPTSGPVGTSVTINGTNFTGATAVKFNGVNQLAFTVNSAVKITAAVPSGATTGRIIVTTPGGTATSATDFTVTVIPGTPIFLSATGAGTVGGKAFTGADILSYVKTTNTWDILYDGSYIRTTKNIGAFAFDGDDILLGFSAAQVVPGLGATAVPPQDLVRFTPTNTGYNNTAGSFAWFFDGSDVGLTTSGEIIDALWIDRAGQLYISTAGSGVVPENSANPTGAKVKFQDEDVLRFTPTSTGATTAGTWMLYWDPTAITGMSAEDINGYWEDPATGNRYVTILGPFTVGNAAYGGRFTGNGQTILRFTPNGAAPGGWAPAEKLTWLASGATFPSNIDGIEMARP